MFKAMNSSILVINCGSSSLKFALIDSASHEAVMTGLAEKLGLADACITFKHNGDKQTALLSAPDHAAAMHAIIEKLQQVSLLDSVKAIGHRVVHGGEHFKQSALLDETAINEIERCIKLAPLHNPAHILASAPRSRSSRACRKWPCSTPPSTRPCRKRPTCTRCR